MDQSAFTNFRAPPSCSDTPVASLRRGHSEVLSQCCACILLAKQAAPLKLWNDEMDEVLIGARHVRCSQHEAIAGAHGEPFLQPIGHVSRSTYELRVIVSGAPPAGIYE